MSMSLLIYLIISKTVECAPKLGPILFDPLTFESAEYDDKVRSTPSDIAKLSSKLSQLLHYGLNKSEIPLSANETLTSINEKIISNSSSTTQVKDGSTRNIFNDSIKNTSGHDNLRMSPIANDVSKTVFSESSEWLDPENLISKHILTEDNVSKKRFGKELIAISRNINQTNKIHIDESLEILPLLKGDPKKTERREIITPKNILMKILRSSADVVKDSDKPCDGYEYDVTVCRYIGDRYLCGYNKNTGDVKASEKIQNLGNGCRIRGDRMECGYEIGPFNQSPDGDQNNDEHINHVVKLVMKNKTPPTYTTTETTSHKTSVQTIINTKQSTKSPDTSKIIKTLEATSSSKTPRTVKKACHEENGHQVCYEIPL